jgi:hypothetical protein
MQGIIGYGVLAFIILIAIGFSPSVARKHMRMMIKKGVLGKLLATIISFVIIVIGSYAVLSVICGIFWVIAWIGIFIREVFQWMIEAVLYPLRQLI